MRALHSFFVRSLKHREILPSTLSNIQKQIPRARIPKKSIQNHIYLIIYQYIKLYHSRYSRLPSKRHFVSLVIQSIQMIHKALDPVLYRFQNRYTLTSESTKPIQHHVYHVIFQHIALYHS